MKKTIMLLFIMFFITGCEKEADYTLEIFSDTIKETASITLKEDDYDKANYLNDIFSITSEQYDNDKDSGSSIISEIKKEELNATSEPDDLFQKSIKEDEITLNFNYNNDNYGISKIFTSCFNKTYYDSTEKYYVIKGYDRFKCLYKEEVKIAVKTDYKVIDSNADEINGNEYIWYFNEDNYIEHEVYLQVSKQLKRKSHITWKMYIAIAMLIIFILYKLINKKNTFSIKKNNEV